MYSPGEFVEQAAGVVSATQESGVDIAHAKNAEERRVRREVEPPVCKKAVRKLYGIGAA